MKFPSGDLFILVFFLIGASLLGGAYYLYKTRYSLEKNGIATKGIVIDLHQLNPHKSPMAPSIRYKLRDGRDLIYHSSEAQNPPAYSIGEEVMLYYNPAQPEEIQLAGDYFMVYVLAGMSAIFLLISIWGTPSAVVSLAKWAFVR